MNKRSLRTALALAVLLLLSIQPSHAGEPPPIEAFGSMPSSSEVTLSPNGSLLAWFDASGNEANVVIYDIATQKLKRTIPIGGKVKPRALNWADNETLLIELSFYEHTGRHPSYRYEVWRTIAADVSGGKDRLLLMQGGSRPIVTGAILLSTRSTKPKTVIMWSWDESWNDLHAHPDKDLASSRNLSAWVSQVFEVDTRTGKGKSIEVGTKFTDDWAVDANGNVVARTEWDPKGEVAVVLAKSGGTWRELLRRQHQGTFKLYGVNRDATAVIISGINDQNRSTLVALPIDGSQSKTLFDDPASGVNHVYYDRFTNAPIAAALEGIEQKIFWFDPMAEKQFRAVAKAFPEKSVIDYEWSENGKRALAKVQGPSNPSIYYLIDFETHKADIVGEQYPGLANVTLGEMRPIAYKARDGANIPAYLTLPPESTGKLPLVVLPHSDMEGRDDYIFDWLAQFLASRGYAVLQPQFRGSSGFGEAWRKAGKGQWGKLMQNDVTDGIQAMIDQGIADSQRICIAGVDYGGYAALAGAAFTPQLYRCAVSVNGLADLPELIAYQKRHWGDDSDLPAYWQDLIGSPFDPDVIAKSPVTAAKQITAPVLLMHATQDSIFPPAQSDSMFRALKQYKKPVTLIRLEGEDHWLSTTAARRKMLAEIEKFLDANLH